jgi:hypothetical protein
VNSQENLLEKYQLKNQLKMTVIFRAQNHKYESLDPDERIDWLSVTSFVALFKKKFDAATQSVKSSKNKKSKWYGMDPEEIQAHWAQEANRAVTAGTFYHDQRESDLMEIETIQRQGVAIPIIKPIFMGDVKHAPVQRLMEGIYPEHFIYLKSAGICGQSDRVEVVRDVIDVIDYKTNKEIKKHGFKSWDGVVEKMLGPCAHLDDCNFNHYALQLSAYMYMMLKHNPQHKPGKMMLHHVIFEKDGEDKFGNPIIRKDDKGNPIVKTVIPYEVPYLKSEIRNMIAWLQENKNKVK